jgi:hypothetical protein
MCTRDEFGAYLRVQRTCACLHVSDMFFLCRVRECVCDCACGLRQWFSWLCDCVWGWVCVSGRIQHIGGRRSQVDQAASTD